MCYYTTNPNTPFTFNPFWVVVLGIHYPGILPGATNIKAHSGFYPAKQYQLPRLHFKDKYELVPMIEDAEIGMLTGIT
jgi:hypothetical protein